MSKLNDFYTIIIDKQKQKDYNDEMVNKTWHYQKKFGFETSSRKDHEFWNNEADAFKHAFGSADMFFKYGDIGSLSGGINHEWKQKQNPHNEWNMDSWNNHQGREIAREIQKEYGSMFSILSQQQRDDIIAVKVIDRMKNGQLITNPNDKRVYDGKIEKFFNEVKKSQELNPFSTNLKTNKIIQELLFKLFDTRTPSQIKKEPAFLNYKNPLTGNDRIFTREDLGAMSIKDFEEFEKEIMAQVKFMNGKMPTNSDLNKELQNGGVIYVDTYTRSDGTIVNGHYRSRPSY